MSHRYPRQFKIFWPIIKAAEEAGWHWRHTKGHLRLAPPKGQRNGCSGLTLPGTPSDRRTIKNTYADARRAGFDVKEP